MTNRYFDTLPIANDTRDLVQLFGLDMLVARPAQPLACRWSRDADGTLVCRWTPDILALARP